MKNRYLFILLGIIFNLINAVSANEITFEGKDINISENGNRIISNQGTAYSIDHGLKIKADNFDYKKRCFYINCFQKKQQQLLKKKILLLMQINLFTIKTYRH